MRQRWAAIAIGLVCGLGSGFAIAQGAASAGAAPAGGGAKPAVAAVQAVPSKAGATPQATLTQAIENTFKGVRADPAASGGDLDATRRVVAREFLPYTDFLRTTQLAVGSNWKNATPAQQKQLFEQFQALLVRVYALQLSQVQGQTLKFSYSSPQINANGTDAVVRAGVKGIGDDLQVGYRLTRSAGGWKIYDIDMGGAWLILVYQQQFADQIAQGGIPGLINFLARHNGAPAA
jgi:phospholipid transport system substrate-binding protein